MSVSKQVILLACGSFNPVTNMHLRMFELARDYLHGIGFKVVSGIISPVHDAYGKKGLISSKHRCAMAERAVETSNWIISVDRWESLQPSWTPTRKVLDHYQADIKAKYSDLENCPRVKLLIGADVLESFAVPNLWQSEDIESIVKNYGLVVITRVGSNPLQFIEKSEILTKYKSNIHVVFDWIVNEITATSIRRALSENKSVKYLLQDSVINYICTNELYKVSKST